MSVYYTNAKLQKDERPERGETRIIDGTLEFFDRKICSWSKYLTLTTVLDSVLIISKKRACN